MNFLNIFKQISEEKFRTAKLENTGEIAPRNGFYFLIDVTVKRISVFDEVAIASVNWKNSLDDKFIEGEVSEIALSNLVPANPNQSKEIDFAVLIGKTIHVSSSMLVWKSFGLVQKLVVSAMWELVIDTPFFINAQNAGAAAFNGNAKTLYEAYQIFVETAPYDVALAEDMEATGEGYYYGDEADEGFDEGYGDSDDLVQA